MPTRLVNVSKLLPDIYADVDLPSKMDESRHLFAFSDKVVDLDRKEVRDIRPNDYISIHTGYEYPSTSHPEIREEINKLLLSMWDEYQTFEYVMRTLAVNLHGVKRFELFFVWTGLGGNGKGLLRDLLKRAVGGYFHSIPSECLTKRSDKKDAPNPPMAKSKGKRFVFAQEPDVGDKIQSSTIKEQTGNDEISPRELYHNPVSYVPQFGLFLQCNDIPNLSAIDGGITRRMIVVPFPFQFVDDPKMVHQKQKDINFKTKIMSNDLWRNEFMLMLLETYQSIGLTLQESNFVNGATDDYLADNNTVKIWLEENYIQGMPQGKQFKLSATELLADFQMRNESKMTAAKFKSLMILNGVIQKKENNAFEALKWNAQTRKR
jgi:P4 family phage/plasmid primase-like protien